MIKGLFRRRRDEAPQTEGALCPRCNGSLVVERDGAGVNRTCPRCRFARVDARTTFVEAALMYPMR